MTQIIGMSYEEIRRRHDELDLASENKTLTEQMLDEAVELVVDHSDGPHESIGWGWIKDNTTEFTGVVKDPLAFMRRHLDNRYFTQLVILYTEVLQLIPEAERPRYVRDSIMKHGARNCSWTEAALKAGIDRAFLGQLILDRLEATTEQEMQYACFLHDFLEYGSGQIEKVRFSDFPETDRRSWRLEEDTEWAVLNDAQFVQAMQICVRKAPNRVVHSRMKIWLRLSDEMHIQVLIDAVSKMDHVCSLDVLRILPMEVRLSLARRLKPLESLHLNNGAAPTAQFLVELALEQGGFTGSTFFSKVEHVLAAADAATIYRNVWLILNEAKKQKGEKCWLAERIEKKLAARLNDSGYCIGTIEEGRYTDRRTGRECRQMQVRITGDNMTYVQDRNQHRYFPHVGDCVLFRPSRGMQLTPRVKAVMFVPATHGGEC